MLNGLLSISKSFSSSNSCHVAPSFSTSLLSLLVGVRDGVCSKWRGPQPLENRQRLSEMNDREGLTLECVGLRVVEHW